MKEDIRNLLLDTGASAVGFAKAGETASAVQIEFSKWIGEGNQGDMSYLERHKSLRKHTDNVLPGARTVISLAFDFKPDEWRKDSLPTIAAYAYGEDYHNVIRNILKPTLDRLKELYTGNWRLCIDSAPVEERYWAMKSGIGIRGLNGMVMADDTGPFCFLAEILTTLEIEPDKPSERFCIRCGKCIEACPSGALKGDGTMDAGKCINYLTIEKKGEFAAEEIEWLNTGAGFLFGCDKCLRCCLHGETKKVKRMERLKAFALNEETGNLTPQRILSMDSQEFKKIFSKSPLLYAGYSRLLRNSKALKTESTGNS